MGGAALLLLWGGGSAAALVYGPARINACDVFVQGGVVADVFVPTPRADVFVPGAMEADVEFP